MDDARQRAAFEAALAADRCDWQTRLVFADWLEERGLDDQAQEQRRMGTPEWVESARWLAELADELGPTCENYHFHPTGLPRKWRKITYEDVIEAGYIYVRSEGAESFVQEGSGEGQYLGIDPAVFWGHWCQVTGENCPETDFDGTSRSLPFLCSC